MKFSKLILVLLLSVAAFGQHNTFGTYKKNVAKCKYEPAGRPGTDAPYTRIFIDHGNGWVQARSFRDATKPYPDIDIIFKRDGNEYTNWTRGVAEYGTLKFVKVGPRSWQYTGNREGQVNTNSKSVESFSEDGKTYTVETTGKMPDGRPRHDIEIFERQ